MNDLPPRLFRPWIKTYACMNSVKNLARTTKKEGEINYNTLSTVRKNVWVHPQSPFNPVLLPKIVLTSPKFSVELIDITVFQIQLIILTGPSCALFIHVLSL